MNKDTLNKVLQEIKKMQRYDQVWEWMEERKKGDYILFDELHKWILTELKKDYPKEDE